MEDGVMAVEGTKPNFAQQNIVEALSRLAFASVGTGQHSKHVAEFLYVMIRNLPDAVFQKASAAEVEELLNNLLGQAAGKISGRQLGEITSKLYQRLEADPKRK